MQNLKEFVRTSEKSITSEEMHALELNSQSLGIDVNTMMNNAGSAVANFVKKKFPDQRHILVVCGPGNNGGDGFAAAKHLSNEKEVTVALVTKRSAVRSGAAFTNLDAIEEIPSITILDSFVDDGPAGVNKLKGIAKSNQVIVDAIFGTGFRGEIDGYLAKIVDVINKAKRPVVAVDVPSGLNSDDGSWKVAIKANYTLTFYKMKKGLENCKIAGKTFVVDIGIPREAELYTGPGDVYLATRPMSLFTNKSERGRVLIIGGSTSYYGAPILAANAAYSALAALRTGAGYATICVPKEIAGYARSLSPNLLVKEIGNETIENSAELRESIDRVEAVVIGNGISKDADALNAAARIIEYSVGMDKKVVVDADAIHAISNVKGRSKNIIITPHDKEFYSVSKIKLPKENLEERVEKAIHLAKKLGVVVLLKGHNTIITDSTSLKISSSQTPALATMGTGDVLAGIIGAYAAAGANTFRAGVAGAHVHSRIGDMLAAEKGAHILATDVVAAIPGMLKEFDRFM